MKKRILFLLIMFSFSFINAQTQGTNFDGKIILRINGHDHSLPNDILNEFNKTWQKSKGDIERDIIGQGNNDAKVIKASLNNRINRLTFQKGADDEHVKIKMSITNNSMLLKLRIWRPNILGWKPSVYNNAPATIDINIDATAKILTDSLKIVFEITEASYKAELVKLHAKASIVSYLTLGVSYFIESLFYEIVEELAVPFDDDLDDYIGEQFPLFSLADIDGDTYLGDPGDPVMEDIINSVPFDIHFLYDNGISYDFGSGTFKSYQKLVVDIDFLHGYYDDSDVFHNEYSNYTPTSQNVLQYAGFGYLHWGKFSYIKKNQTLTMIDRVDTLIQRMGSMGLNQLRVEAMWDSIYPTINSIDPSLDPDNITNADVDAYVAQGNWQTLDAIINKIKGNSTIITRPVLTVGSGHDSRPPRYDNGTPSNTADDLIIAPGASVRGAGKENYLAVPENVYLYWLKIYTRAVVNKYSDQIAVFQAETELNASRFTESFDQWWRKGIAWTDDSINGFQTDVARTLYNAITYEAETRLGNEVDVVQQFHVFNSAKRIKEWAGYYDIVGLNIYPHLMHAYPVVGFMPGEFIWAARRILKSLGPAHEQKPVWILETGYGSNTSATPPTDFTDNTIHYSYDRQVQYLKEALYGCAINGAEAFQWYLMETNELDDEDIEMEKNNNYIGFYDDTGARKEGYYAFKNTFALMNTGIEATLSNKYQQELLGGSFNIEGVANGIYSGGKIRLNQNEDYLLRTNSQYLGRPATSDTVQHLDWNDAIKEHFLSHDINLNSDDPVQEAKFNNTYPLNIELIVPGVSTVEFERHTKIRDPWWLSANGKNRDVLQTFAVTSDTNYYNMFQFMQPFSNDTLIPYYSIRPPEVLYFENDEIAVFNNWEVVQDVEIKNDPRKSGDRYQKAVVAIGNMPELKANYYHNIIVEDANIYFTNDHLELKASQLVATNNSLYEFVEWKLYESDGVTENSSKATLESTTNYKTSVIINESMSVIKPIYKQINHLEDYIVNLNKDEVLLVPEDTKIHFAEGVVINVYGNLDMRGSYGKEIVFSRDPVPDFHYNELFKIYPITDYEGQVEFDRSIIEYVHFKNFWNGVIRPAPIKFVGSGWTTYQKISIENCVFDSCDNAIVTDFSGGLRVEFENCTFAYTNFLHYNGGTDINFYNCIFYETNFEDHYYARYCTFWPTASGFWVNCTVQNPNFVDVANGNFHLQWGSPCIDINNGTPDRLDPDGTLMDDGAFFYAQFSDSLYADDVTISGEARIKSDFTVQQGKTLTINPGTVLKIDKDVNINVNGKLTAKATATDSIIFTSIIPNPSSGDYWSGITFKEDASNSGSIKYCRIENADNGIMIKNNSEVSNNFIRNITSKGIYMYKSTALLKNNRIVNCGYAGIYVSRTDYVSGEQEILDNEISNCSSYGIRFYYSSPSVRGNEISDCNYGIYCYKSSPYLGGFSGYGNNYIHDNNYGLRAYQSSPFLGEEYCDINGGHNWISNNNNYNIYASSSSSIMAEVNWWGSSPPQSSKFNISSSSSLDYTPYLSSSPSLNKKTSPEDSVFDLTLGKLSIALDDSLLTEEEAMSNFDSSWDTPRKLKFARNLVNLNFPESANHICKNIISTEPDMMHSYLAFDIIWKSGKLNDEEFQKFRSYIDSLGKVQNQNELEEYAEFVDQQYGDECLGKISSVQSYKRYNHVTIAANVLLNDLEYKLIEKRDEEKALLVFALMKSEFSSEPETMEAAILLGLIDGYEPDETSLMPLKYELAHNYPNPFNSTTNIKFGLPEASNVKIEIFSIIGQKVKTIQLNNVAPGYHKQVWEGKNEFGNIVATGMYIYKFTVKSITNKKLKFEKIRKMLLIK